MNEQFQLEREGWGGRPLAQAHHLSDFQRVKQKSQENEPLTTTNVKGLSASSNVTAQMAGSLEFPPKTLQKGSTPWRRRGGRR